MVVNGEGTNGRVSGKLMGCLELDSGDRIWNRGIYAGSLVTNGHQPLWAVLTVKLRS